jgi:hypothetical protein
MLQVPMRAYPPEKRADTAGYPTGPRGGSATGRYRGSTAR